MKILSLAVVLLLLVACGPTISRHSLDYNIRVDAMEIRMPTSTVPLGIVTQDGKVVGVVSGAARPLIDIPLSLLGAGSTVGGAAVLGGAIKSGLKGIEAITPSE